MCLFPEKIDSKKKIVRKVWNFHVKFITLHHPKCNGMMNEEERLVKILQLSHSQVLAGKSYSQEEAERYLDDRLYELRNKMVGTCVAELRTSRL